MLKVVSNTTPILSLLKIGQLPILKSLYNKVYVPLEVFNEIEKGKYKAHYIDIKQLSYIEICEIQNRNSLLYLFDLDLGEAETIVLASELQADLLIIDEKLGRYHANNLNLKITGTLGLLIKAKKEGFIDKLEPLLINLQSEGIWISNTLFKQVLQLVGEN